jgi:hypothetical protein
MVGKIATGEIEEEKASGKSARGRAGGLKGGQSRSESLTPEKRREIAKLAAESRWKKSK